MSLSYLFDPNKQFQDEAGNNDVNGFLRVYIDGTDDIAITYKDFDGTLNQSDIMLDINGRAVVIVDRSKTYRLEVYKRDGGMLWTARPMIPSSEGGGGIDPEDLKDLVIKHGGRNSRTYSPTVGATIDIPKSCEVVSELEDDLYGKITSIIADFRTPVLIKSDLDPETPGVTRDFYYWPTARTGADGDYSFVGYDGGRTEIATVHEDNSVSYRTVPNGVHRLMEVWNEDGDPAPYGYWIADLERPNPDAPCGYEWAYAHDILEGIRNGEVFVLYCYAAFPIDTTTPVMHMTKIENQSGVDSLGNHYEAVRIYFDSCSYTGEPGMYAATSIYTPDINDTSHTGRMAVLNWNGSINRYVNFKLADDNFVEKNYNKVQSLDNNSSHYPSCPAVKEAIDTAVASAYHAAGTMTVAQLTSALLVANNQGNVYNITDSGATTSDFVDGAGHPIVAGDNVGVCDIGGGVYKFDLLSGFVDLSGYLAKTGDGSNVTATFTAASSRTNITTGNKLSVIFGKIAKWFGDLKALAFKDNISDSDISGTISDEHIASASDWDAKADTNKVVAIADATVSRYNYGGGSSWYKVAECNLKRTEYDANTSFDIYFSRGSWRSYGQLNVCVRNMNPLRIRLNELYMESTEPNFGFKLVTRGTNSTPTAVAEIWAYCNENEGGVALIERNGVAGAYATDSKSIWTYTSYGINDAGTEAPVEDPSAYVVVSDTDVIIRLSSKGGNGSNVTSTFTKASGDTSSIASGGKLSAIFTAISSFFSTIASHIANRSNPHNVTAAQTGAEPAFSILPVNKGGTGKDTVNSAANNFIYNLQLTSSDIASDNCEIITGDANHTPSNLLTFYKRPVSALWAYIKSKLIGSTSNVNQVDSDTETSNFTFVNGHIYHLTMYLQGSTLRINTGDSGTGYVAAYIGVSIGQSHYSCRQFVNIQNGELTTDDIRLPIDWKAENIEGSGDNKLHVVVVLNNTRYSFTSSSNYNLTLIGTDFNGAP